MRTRDLVLDFTSLMDVLMIILFLCICTMSQNAAAKQEELDALHVRFDALDARYTEQEVLLAEQEGTIAQKDALLAEQADSIEAQVLEIAAKNSTIENLTLDRDALTKQLNELYSQTEYAFSTEYTPFSEIKTDWIYIEIINHESQLQFIVKYNDTKVVLIADTIDNDAIRKQNGTTDMTAFVTNLLNTAIPDSHKPQINMILNYNYYAIVYDDRENFKNAATDYFKKHSISGFIIDVQTKY